MLILTCQHHLPVRPNLCCHEASRGGQTKRLLFIWKSFWMSVIKVSPIINAPCSKIQIQLFKFFKEMFPFCLKVKIQWMENKFLSWYLKFMPQIIQVNNCEIVVNFFHSSHNLTWYSKIVQKFNKIYPVCSTYELTRIDKTICVNLSRKLHKTSQKE